MHLLKYNGKNQRVYSSVNVIPVCACGRKFIPRVQAHKSAIIKRIIFVGQSTSTVQLERIISRSKISATPVIKRVSLVVAPAISLRSRGNLQSSHAHILSKGRIIINHLGWTLSHPNQWRQYRARSYSLRVITVLPVLELNNAHAFADSLVLPAPGNLSDWIFPSRLFSTPFPISIRYPPRLCALSLQCHSMTVNNR